MKSAGARTFGRYRLVERLGRGGMAEVWKAQVVGPAGFQRWVVCKRILAHLAEDPRFVKMFLAEAALSAKLTHPNIVQVFELGDVEGDYFIGMELVDGRDLNAIMRAQIDAKRVSVDLAILVAREVCRALAYAHRLADDEGQPLHITHRDVSPGNVMVSFGGDVKLLDFGIAKALTSVPEERTNTGTTKGKLSYLSPEQIEGEEVDHRSDIFAIGVVLHEMLTGRRLFKAATELKTMEQIREAAVTPPSHINPEVPPELDDICLRALARERDARYDNADEMALDLDIVVRRRAWGPEQLRKRMRELFAEELSQTRLALPEFEAGPDSAPRPRRRPRRRVIAAAVAGTAAVAALLLWSSTRHPAVITPPPIVGVKPPTPPPPAPRPPQTITVRLTTTPVTAQVFVAGETAARATTPATLALPHSTQPLTLWLRAAGHEPREVTLVPDRDSHLEFTLAASPRPPRPPRPKQAAIIKPGTIVDPFE